MVRARIPHARVWVLGQEYVEAAEILLDYNRLQPAVILSALAIEIFLKSFLAKSDARGHVETDRGHSLLSLFGKLSVADQDDIQAFSAKLDATIDVPKSLRKFDSVFTAARYRYEASAPKSIGSDTLHFARHLCDTILALGKARKV